ncbi:hypothetical protein LXL04_013928 [Taraxacum kok-saghyz]
MKTSARPLLGTDLDTCLQTSSKHFCKRKKRRRPKQKKGAALHRSSFFFGSSSRLPFSTLHLPRAPARCLPAIQRASTSTAVAITDADSDAGPALPADSNAALQASISDFLPPYTESSARVVQDLKTVNNMVHYLLMRNGKMRMNL